MDVSETASIPRSKDASIVYLPLNVDRTQIDCILTGRDYFLYMHLPNYPSCRDCTIHTAGSQDLRSLLAAGKFHARKLEECSSVDSLVQTLASIIENHDLIHGVASEKGGVSMTDYEDVIREMDAIGWENLASVNKSFTELRLRSTDRMDREHHLTVKLASGTPEFSADYPKPFHYNWREGSCLKKAYEQFCQESDLYQNFWSAMEDLDANCFVLEPENPSRSDTYRKIVVSNKVSLRIEVDPNHPRSFPTITWLGSETAVFDFREKLISNVEMWEDDVPIHENLERILEVTLPKRSNFQTAETYDVMCVICYSDRLDGEVPSRTCDNPQCGQSFHIYCLYEWLRSVTHRQYGNKVFGPCPYCEQPISCKPPEK